jgi:GNAT superfamily N-acetyltransferase
MADRTVAGITIRPIREEERTGLAELVRSNWGSPVVVSRGLRHEVAGLPCLVAIEGERWLGVAAYRIDGDECELVLLHAIERRHGVGTALLEAVIDIARRSNSRRLWLVTTNDNLDALRFYQRRGLHLARVWADATTRAREIKPEIPLIGDFGIAIRDELELEVVLAPDATSSPTGDPGRERGSAPDQG